MGDHRFDARIEFTMHGKTYKMGPCWLSWFDDGSGVDSRITNFFRESAADALARYDAQAAEQESEQRAKETEAHERAELGRLMAKYEHAR